MSQHCLCGPALSCHTVCSAQSFIARNSPQHQEGERGAINHLLGKQPHTHLHSGSITHEQIHTQIYRWVSVTASISGMRPANTQCAWDEGGSRLFWFALWSCFILSVTNSFISLMNIIGRIALTQHLSLLMANVMLCAHIPYCRLSHNQCWIILPAHPASLEMSVFGFLGHQPQWAFKN